MSARSAVLGELVALYREQVEAASRAYWDAADELRPDRVEMLDELYGPSNKTHDDILSMLPDLTGDPVAEACLAWNDLDGRGRTVVPELKAQLPFAADALPEVTFRVCCPFKQDQLVPVFLVEHPDRVSYLRESNLDPYFEACSRDDMAARLNNERCLPGLWADEEDR